MNDEPSDVAAPLPGVSVPWYTSAVQRTQVVSAVTALIALFPKAGALLGIKTPDQVAVWVEAVFGFATLAAPIAGIIWRAASRLQPLTWTKKAAAAAPAIPIQATPPVAVIDPKLPEILK
jgi:hypothetical protein